MMDFFFLKSGVAEMLIIRNDNFSRFQALLIICDAFSAFHAFQCAPCTPCVPRTHIRSKISVVTVAVRNH